jgi:hypothetical protein
MPKKETAGDKIKKLFAAISGSANDWKRVSIEKGLDGRLVRVFEHKKDSTRRIEATELGGDLIGLRLPGADDDAAFIRPVPVRRARAGKSRRMPRG